jgi:DnaJ-domain-containing protein 1
LIAFDGFKALDVRMHFDTDYLRRSLQKLFSKKHPMHVGYITPDLWLLLIQKKREADAKGYGS